MYEFSPPASAGLLTRHVHAERLAYAVVAHTLTHPRRSGRAARGTHVVDFIMLMFANCRVYLKKHY